MNDWIYGLQNYTELSKRANFLTQKFSTNFQNRQLSIVAQNTNILIFNNINEIFGKLLSFYSFYF